MGAELEQDDTIIIDLNEKGAIVVLKGHCKAGNFKRQICRLKEALRGSEWEQ